MSRGHAVSAERIEAVFGEEYGRAVAVLVRVFGDIDIAEEAVQDAFTEAVRRWPAAGLPPSPAGWIITTARNRAIDRLRREASRADRHAQSALLNARDEPAEEGAVRDDRLRLIFTCCHPALGMGACRADAPAPGRPHHGRDRSRVPGPRQDHGPAARTGQGEDP
jgi:RNA polymerase sigma-70 factor, ECF subfamily